MGDNGYADPGQTGGTDPNQNGYADPGQTGGTDPNQNGYADPGQTGGGRPGGADPGQTGGGGHPQAALVTSPSAGPRVVAHRRLNFKIQQQQQSEWCWAACAVSVEKYYDRASKLTQCEVANKVLPLDIPGFKPPSGACCSHPEDCNLLAELETALKVVHKWRTTLDQEIGPKGCVLSTGTISFEHVRREIDNGRPIGAGILWFSGGGHFVIIRGYRLLSSGARQVYVADPLNPSALVDFDEFSYAYYGEGTWAETDLTLNDLG